jgi:hypothetical protein
VTSAVTRQKYQVNARVGARKKLVRGFSPGAFDGLPLGIFQAIDLIDARTANNAQYRFCHEIAEVEGMPGLLAYGEGRTSRGAHKATNCPK